MLKTKFGSFNAVGVSTEATLMHKVNDRESGYRTILMLRLSGNGMKINCMELLRYVRYSGGDNAVTGGSSNMTIEKVT